MNKPKYRKNDVLVNKYGLIHKIKRIVYDDRTLEPTLKYECYDGITISENNLDILGYIKKEG